MHKALSKGAIALGVALSATQAEKLTAYMGLVVKWNQRFNLVSRRDIGRLLERHVLDSLGAWRYLRGARLLDVGSGAGLPGIPLAVSKPQMDFILCDRMATRCRFLKHVVQRLEIQNVEVVQADVAALSDGGFDTITARAVASTEVMWQSAQSKLALNGCMLIFESTDDTERKIELDARVQRVAYQVPGLEEKHTMVTVERL